MFLIYRAHVAVLYAVLVLVLAKSDFLEHVQHRFLAAPAAAYSPVYESRVRSEELRSRQMSGAVVFVGDSRIESFAVSTVARRAENFSDDGDDIDRVVYRLRRLDLSHAALAIVAVGLNDRPRQFKDFGARYRALLALIPENVPVVASAILPVNPEQVSERTVNKQDFTGVPASLPAANAAIREACASREGCVFFDGSGAVAGDDGLLQRELNLDGVHLNEKGYALWARALLGFGCGLDAARSFFNCAGRKPG